MNQKTIFSIVSFNTRQALDDCLKSIKKTQKSHKVFVFDNASTDGSQEMVRKKYPEAVLFESEKNIGFGPAHNKILKKENYDFAVITNSDIVFLNTIEKTIDFMKNKKIGAGSIKLLNPDGTIQKNVFPMPNLKNEIMARIPLAKNPYKEYKFDYEKISRVECFGGACFVVNKRALEQVGFFDESFFAYAEETDLFFRMQKKGWQIWYCPKAKAIHLGGQSTKELEKKHLMYFKNLLRFFRKNKGRCSETALRIIAAASAALNLLKCAVLLLLEKKKKQEAKLSIGIIKICLGFG